MDFHAAKQAVEDWCACAWVDESTIRSLTAEEARLARLQQAKPADEVMVGMEVPGLKFTRPKTTKYIPPRREAYEELDGLAVRVCKWPRIVSMCSVSL